MPKIISNEVGFRVVANMERRSGERITVEAASKDAMGGIRWTPVAGEQRERILERSILALDNKIMEEAHPDALTDLASVISCLIDHAEAYCGPDHRTKDDCTPEHECQVHMDIRSAKEAHNKALTILKDEDTTGLFDSWEYMTFGPETEAADVPGEVKPTTTCARCGQDFPDRDMMPKPNGEGELCHACHAIENPEEKLPKVEG